MQKNDRSVPMLAALDEADFSNERVDCGHAAAVYAAALLCNITIRLRNGSPSAHLQRRTDHRNNKVAKVMAMRKFLILMLLAGAATPALAAPDNDGTPNRHRGRAERAQSDSDAPRREAPAARSQRNESNGEANRSDGGRRAFGGGAPADVETPRAPRNSAGDNVRSWRQDSDGTPVARVRKSEDRPVLPERPATERRSGVAPDADDNVRNWRRVDRRGNDGPATTIEDRVRPAPNVQEGSLVQPRRPLPRVLDSDRRISRRPVFGTEPPAPRTAESREALSGRRWSREWHRDGRYNWRDWRRRHRSRFHLGFYYDPFGWDYFRYGIGWRLWPSYYRSSYWLNNSSYYRLPQAYGPYRWIRYHNDALLVNIYSGQVVDVIYDFFW